MDLKCFAIKSAGLGGVLMLIFLFSVQLIMAIPAQATSPNSDNCSTSQLPKTIGINAILSENADTGQVLHNSEKSGTVTVSCNAYYDDYDGRYCNYTSGWALVSDVGAVYNTNIPNTYRFANFPPGIGYQALDLHGNPIPVIPSLHDRHDTGVAIRQGGQQIPLSIRLVKLDDSIPPVSDFNFTFKVMCEGNEYANRDVAHSRIYVYAHVTSVAQTCELETPDILVNLPAIERQKLRAVGDTTGNTTFNLNMNCTRDASAKVFFSDANNLPNVSDTLTPSADTTTSGVSFRMLHEGRPVMLVPGGVMGASGTFIDVASSIDNQYISIPLEAEYIQTDRTVEAGKVSAQAMVTIGYE